MPAATAGPIVRAGLTLPPVRTPKPRMQIVTVMPIATGASRLALRRTAVCKTVLTTKKVPSASNANAPK